MQQNIKDSLNRYVNEKIPTGGFLYAVLANDLMMAFARADLENRNSMFEIVKYVHNNLPIDCYGSYEKVERWLNADKTL